MFLAAQTENTEWQKIECTNYIHRVTVVKNTFRNQCVTLAVYHKPVK